MPLLFINLNPLVEKNRLNRLFRFQAVRPTTYLVRAQDLTIEVNRFSGCSRLVNGFENLTDNKCLFRLYEWLCII